MAEVAHVAAPGAQAERVKAFFSQLGYRAYWSLAEKKYAGCALLVKRTCVQPALRFSLDDEAPPEQHDPEGRVILASFGSLDFLGTYVPNQGGSEESFARRRAWDARVRRLLSSRAAGAPRPLVWGGDLNVAAGWEDVGPEPEWFRSKNGQGAQRAEERGQPGFTQAEQERFAELKTATAAALRSGTTFQLLSSLQQQRSMFHRRNVRWNEFVKTYLEDAVAEVTREEQGQVEAIFQRNQRKKARRAALGQGDAELPAKKGAAHGGGGASPQGVLDMIFGSFASCCLQVILWSDGLGSDPEACGSVQPQSSLKWSFMCPFQTYVYFI